MGGLDMNGMAGELQGMESKFRGGAQSMLNSPAGGFGGDFLSNPTALVNGNPFFSRKQAKNKKNMASEGPGAGLFAGAGVSLDGSSWMPESRNYGGPGLAGAPRTNPSRRLGQSSDSLPTSGQLDFGPAGGQDNRFKSPQVSRNNLEKQLGSMNHMKSMYAPLTQDGRRRRRARGDPHVREAPRQEAVRRSARG